MLATVDAEHSPEVRCATDGGASRVPRGLGDAPHVYRRGDAAIAARPDGQRARFQDTSSTWIQKCGSSRTSTPTIRRGELFRNHIYWLAYRDRPVPDAKVAIYPFKREFVVGAASTDVQSGFATMCYLPGIETAGARMLVHQHGRGGQGFLHHRSDGEGGSVSKLA